MKKLLRLSCVLLSVTKIGATQGTEHGGVVVQHSPGHLHRMHDTTIKSHDLINASKSGNMELTIASTDHFELSEMSDEFFGKGQFNEAAHVFISAAIHGSSESKATLMEIEPESLKYLNSQNPQSEVANSYYKISLTPKLIKYFEVQSAELKKHQSTPVKVYNAQ